VDSLFLDYRWDAQKAVQGHGPDIKADSVAGQMSDTTGIIIVKADGYEISFDRPIDYPDGRRDIRGFIDVHNWRSRVRRKALSLAGWKTKASPSIRCAIPTPPLR
jgi:hypothetical protein